MRECIIYEKHKIFLSSEDIRADWIVAHQGTQKEKIFKTIEVCKNEQIDLFVDMGANYGEFTVAVSDIVNKVISFEPNPLVYPFLNKTAALYPNVEVYNCAVGKNNADSEKFIYHDRYSGGGRLNKQWAWTDPRYTHLNKENHYHSVEVPKIDIREFLEKQNFDSLFLKIDIEGKELEIVNHLKPILNDVKKWFCLFEVNELNNSALPGKLIYNFNSDYLIGNYKGGKYVY